MSDPNPRDLAGAVAALADMTCWVITDGKAGDLAQCLGLAKRLGLWADQRVIAPRPPHVWLMPHSWRWPFGIDPSEAPGREGGPLTGPLPDIAIASGRRAAPYLAAIKRASGERTFTVLLKDPRTSAAIADFIWVPTHDRLRGANVMATLLSPHRITPEALAAARQAPRVEIAHLRLPRVAVLIGGTSKDFAFTAGDIDRFREAIAQLAAGGAGIMATTSRRTPAKLREAAHTSIAAAGGWLWDGRGDNPYLAMLANADALLVTAESVNMVGEALVTGKPVHLFRPAGGSRKIDHFLRELASLGVVRPFTGALEAITYEPMDATPAIAIELARRFLAFRKGTFR